MNYKRLANWGITGILLLNVALLLPSCKSDELSDLEKEQKWSQKVYDAMKDIYLWNDALPSSFDKVQYTSADAALNYLTSLKKNASGVAIDKYSFLDKIGNLSTEISQGTASGDYGFMVAGVRDTTNKVVSFVVTYVYKNSPAGKAGIARSYEVAKINGSTDVHPTLGIDGNILASSTAYKSMVNALFYSSSAAFTFKRPDGTTLDVTMNTASYTINSVLCDTVYTVGAKKVGYLVFNEFLGLTAQDELTTVLNKFESKAVQHLVIDLRYNGGGAVATCEMFSNSLTPQSATGKLMYKYALNAKQTIKYDNESLNNYFAKTNSFSPKSLYFIVSDRTASASELLINNLRPYFPGNIYLIGKTTYGKPCGFWATPIGYTASQKTKKEGYDLYAVSFSMTNASGEGDYYDGMTPGSTQYPGVLADDHIRLPWGNVEDGCLSQALYHIQTGAFRTSKAALVKRVGSSQVFNLPDLHFNGMIEFRKKTEILK